jgi:hypothetical protein
LQSTLAELGSLSVRVEAETIKVVDAENLIVDVSTSIVVASEDDGEAWEEAYPVTDDGARSATRVAVVGFQTGL